MLTRARIWAGADGEATLYATLTDMVREDPGQPGAASALGRFAETGGRLALAHAPPTGIAAFVVPECPAAQHIPAPRSPGHVQPEAVAIGGPADHPDIMVPARRALAGLAAALLGYGTDVPAPKPTEGQRPAPVARHRAAPHRRSDRRRRRSSSCATPASATSGDERRRLRVIPTQPAGLLIAAAAAALSEKGWAFVAGRALETLRSGLRTSRARRRRGPGPAARGRARGARRQRRSTSRRPAPSPSGCGRRTRRCCSDRPETRATSARRRRGGAGGAARLADVHARRPAHAQPHRPARLHQPRRRAHRAQGGRAGRAGRTPTPTRRRAGRRSCATPVASELIGFHAIARVRGGVRGRSGGARHEGSRHRHHRPRRHGPEPGAQHRRQGVLGRRLGRLARSRRASRRQGGDGPRARLQVAARSAGRAAPAAPPHHAGQGGRGRRPDDRRAAAAARGGRHDRRRRQRALPQHRAARRPSWPRTAFASSAWACPAARRARATVRR